MGLVELYIEIMENPVRETGACRGNFLNVWKETDHIPLWDLGWRFDYCPGLKGRTVFSMVWVSMVASQGLSNCPH